MLSKGEVALGKECYIECPISIGLVRSGDIGDEGAVNEEGNLRLTALFHVLKDADDLNASS